MSRYAVGVCNMADGTLKVEVVTADTPIAAAHAHSMMQDAVFETQEELDELLDRADMFLGSTVVDDPTS